MKHRITRTIVIEGDLDMVCAVIERAWLPNEGDVQHVVRGQVRCTSRVDETLCDLDHQALRQEAQVKNIPTAECPACGTPLF